MSIYLNYFLIAFVLILLFLIIRLIVIKYFDSQVKKMSSHNYPIIFGLSLVFAGFLAITTIWNEIVNIIISCANQLFGLQLSASQNSQIYNITVYLIFCASVGFILYIYYKDYEKKRQVFLKEKVPNFFQKLKIDPPPKTPNESPIFKNRIKELFELKYKHLELIYDENYKILYGTFQNGLHHYTKLIYCHSTLDKQEIGKDEVEKIYYFLKDEVQKKLSNHQDLDRIDFYYLLENGLFSNHNFPIETFTEDGFINELIDFSSYLRDLVIQYNDKKLPFSNIDDSNIKNTLANTFISPNFNSGKKNLGNYLDIWQKGNNQKHISLLGDYGMGKTSFLKFYASKLAQDILDGKEARIPILISLTGTSPRHRGIKAALSEFMDLNRLDSNTEMLNKLIHRGKLLFLLDGFDEMGFIGSHAQRFEQLNAIWQLATKGNKIIISGRPSYFPNEYEEKITLNILTAEEQKVPQNKPYCERIQLDFFTDSQILESIQTYYPNKSKSKKYFEFVRNNKSIHELCKRPSMMHIVREMLPSLFHEYQNKRLNAGALMERYINHWINRQLEKSIVSAVKQENIKKEFVIDFFTDLAGKFYDPNAGNLSISISEISNFLNQKIKKLQLKSEEEIQGFEHEIQTSYFIERLENKFNFVHKSFFEYFVSKKIKNLIIEKKINSPLVLKKEWTNEITTFLLEAPELVGEKVESSFFTPRLLLLTHSNFMAKVKSFCFSSLAKIYSLVNNSVFYILMSLGLVGAASAIDLVFFCNEISIGFKIFISFSGFIASLFGGFAIVLLVMLIFSKININSQMLNSVNIKINNSLNIKPLKPSFSILIKILLLLSFLGLLFSTLLYKIEDWVGFEYNHFSTRVLIYCLVSITLLDVLLLLFIDKFQGMKFIAKSFFIEFARTNFPIKKYASQFVFIQKFFGSPFFSFDNILIDNTFPVSDFMNSNFFDVKFQKPINFNLCSIRNCTFCLNKNSILSFEDCQISNIAFDVNENIDTIRFRINIKCIEGNIDENSLLALKQLISKFNLNIDKNITGSSWILERIKKEK